MTTKTLCYVSLMCPEGTDRWLAEDVEWRQSQMDAWPPEEEKQTQTPSSSAEFFTEED